MKVNLVNVVSLTESLLKKKLERMVDVMLIGTLVLILSQIILRPNQFCNLTEVVVRPTDTEETLQIK